jgi:hypothetical protein
VISTVFETSGVAKMSSTRKHNPLLLQRVISERSRAPAAIVFLLELDRQSHRHALQPKSSAFGR